MESLLALYAWVLANVDGIVTVWVSAHALALAIINLTPTPTDNEVLTKVYRYVEIAAGIFTAKAKK